ncbi:phospholipid/cholesterol/gamma-HCH transport system substrate-binding protein [Lewinella marina]|uniref:Mce/MlaD domain-containing protein n=1 Tax=Neolewinella marina TaxID=438751 RepID=A0A2G0CAX5_9BACT|nr:MlaD family protein [Neolewinella marina]NJB87196.1 phospholipid/cholesterol/gamma-HCH transport system substrate-binding protein [Neolewinella marina]PHK97077.1 hypothetical protein CGL56_17825 [Neolewinella marina]
MPQSNPVRLGIFVTVACALFIYALLRVSDGLDWFGNTLTVYVDFRDVKGLQPGNSVRFAGVEVGEVDAIDIRNDTTLRVRLDLDAATGDYLRRNMEVDIATDGLVGNMIVTILPGQGEAPLITAGEVLRSQPKAQLSGMLDELAVTNRKLSVITDNLLAVSEKMNAGHGTVGALLNDRGLATNLSATGQQLQESTRNLNRMSQTLDRLLTGAAAGRGNLGFLLHDDHLEAEVEKVGENLDTLIRLRTEPILSELATTAGALRASSEQLNLLMEQLSEEEGMITTLTGDPLAADHLSAILTNLDHGTQKFDINMEALQSNWFFRGYFRRQAREARKAARTKK